MSHIVYDEYAEIGEEFFTIFHDECEHGKRKEYSGQRVMFTLDLNERTTLSWLEPDPEYARPAKADSPL